jgi:PKD repeat protein
MNRLFLLLVILITSNKLNAQIDNEFWFTIPKETSGHGTLSQTNNVNFNITAMQLDATVTISMPANPNFTPRTFKIVANQSRTEVLATTFVEFAEIYNNNTTTGVVPISGKTNKGILITADNEITVYYDYNNVYNSELFTLKGKNALGTEFYVPFQNIWNNGVAHIPQPYSSIEIVATEDGTEVDIYPTKAIQGFSFPGTIHISLNRGEAYSLRTNEANASDHPAGTKIVANKNISVITNDDSVKGANGTTYDVVGDQIIPISLLGTQYLVLLGSSTIIHAGSSAKDILRGEQVFVTATKPNTQITFKGTDGSILYTTLLNAGQTDYFSPNITNTNQTSVYIETTDASKPFYTYHLTDIQGEVGGAILPPVQVCNGSDKVNIALSNVQNKTAINLFIAYNKSLPFEDPSQPYHFFKLYNASYPAGFEIPSDWFEPNISAGIAILKLSNRDFSSLLSLSGTNQFVNSKNLFHLGMSNGTAGRTNKYGYFSAFGTNNPGVVFDGTNSTDLLTCFGETIRLAAKGGAEYTWHYGSPSGPPTYLSDPKSSIPEILGCPIGNHQFYVEIKSWCNTIEILRVSLTVLKSPSANITIDKSTICSPAIVSITNNSIDGDIFVWKKQINNGIAEKLAPLNNLSFNDSTKNNSGEPLKTRYTLIVQTNSGCSDSVSKELVIYPKIDASFTPSIESGCTPLQVQFNYNKSSASSYYWDFNDGYSSVSKEPTHTYLNSTDRDTSFKVKLIISSPFNCMDTAVKSIIVHPKPIASFATDVSNGLSPLAVSFNNNSQNGNSSFWIFGDQITSLAINPSHTFENLSATPINYDITLISSNALNCSDTTSRSITVYQQVIAEFTQDTTAGKSPLIVQFNNKTKNASKIKWDFGDGSSSFESNPSHTFINTDKTPVYYMVKLLAWNDYGSKDSASVIVTVMTQCKTKADFRIDKIEGPTPLIVKFRNISSNATMVLWDFGDNTTSSAETPVHMFENTSIVDVQFDVKLIASDANCGEDTASMIVLVHPPVIVMNNKNIISSNLKAYPIPTKDLLYLDYSVQHPSDAIIEISDASGKILTRYVEANKPIGNSISIVDLTKYNGILFFIKLSVDGETKVLKVLKE